MKRHLIANRVLALLSTLIALPLGAAMTKTEYSRVELIAEQASLPASGGTATVGFFLEPEPGWHAYWINPGDAGKAPSIRWSLPDGFVAGELRFPTPHLIPFGEFNTYGFDEPILLLAEISIPVGLAQVAVVALGGKARWVVCDDELCVPEQADITLALPVADGSPNAANTERFAAARAKLPSAANWPARFAVADGSVDFDVAVPTGLRVEAPYLFVAPRRVVQYGEQTSVRSNDGLRFAMTAGRRAEAATEIAAVLRYDDPDGNAKAVALQFTRTDGPLPPAVAQTSAETPATGTSLDAPFDVLSMLQALLFGVLGGLVLNLMPCVFPILSMKALGLVQLAQADRGEARASGLLYTAGVLIAFLAVAVLLVALRAAGAAVGWGFHLQAPLVNVGLGLLMVGIGLNLAGVFEIGTRLMGLGQSAGTGGGERRAAFLTGLLAVVVATPCSAPFMAGALGYALAQPVPIALAVFLALGLGLALPYLVLTFVPALGRLLPKPGPWMAVFRQVLAFPMLATALWLFWVVGRQLGPTAMGMALFAALLFAFTLWAHGRVAASTRAWGWRCTAIAGLAACVFAAAQVQSLGNAPAREASDGGQAAGRLGKLEYQRFTPELVQGYIQAQTPVFVYFTADWCISCKVNERVALASDAVGETMTARGIQVVQGDWTAQDPVITEWLVRYDRPGVPLYLYFPPGSSLETAIVLPQILLPETVIDAIDDAA